MLLSVRPAIIITGLALCAGVAACATSASRPTEATGTAAITRGVPGLPIPDVPPEADIWTRALVDSAPPGVAQDQWRFLPWRTRYRIWKLAAEIVAGGFPTPDMREDQIGILATTIAKDFTDAMTWAYGIAAGLSDGTLSERQQDMAASALMRCKCHAALRDRREWAVLRDLGEDDLDRIADRLVSSLYVRDHRTSQWTEDRLSASSVGSQMIRALVSSLTRGQQVDGTKCVANILAHLRTLPAFNDRPATPAPRR